MAANNRRLRSGAHSGRASQTGYSSKSNDYSEVYAARSSKRAGWTEVEEISSTEGKQMHSINPKDAIVAFVSAPSITLVDIPAPNTQGWRMQQNAGGLGAKSETIRFVKEHHLPHRQLHYVT